jgi:hypothetical protein
MLVGNIGSEGLCALMGGIGSLSFLSPGNFPDEDPYAGPEETLRLFEYGERLGFDGAWIRQRHLEHGVSSGAVFLAGEGATDFSAHQVSLFREYRSLRGENHPGRIAIGRVIVPFDSADRATRERYRAYAASRHERTLKPQGPRGVLIAPDIVGPAEEIAERLLADAAVREVSELRAELPYEFSHRDYEQILHDVLHVVAPRLGWRPAATDPVA